MKAILLLVACLVLGQSKTAEKSKGLSAEEKLVIAQAGLEAAVAQRNLSDYRALEDIKNSRLLELQKAQEAASAAYGKAVRDAVAKLGKADNCTLDLHQEMECPAEKVGRKKRERGLLWRKNR